MSNRKLLRCNGIIRILLKFFIMIIKMLILK